LVREGHRLGLPRAGKYKQILNTDSEAYCGGGFGVVKTITAENVPSQGLDYSAEITLPPLAMMWFEAPAKS
jgi:1,4-alpha-glucan branching enzyme